MNAVIFLCPISGFNQQLAEDINVNRLVRSPRAFITSCLRCSSQYDSTDLWEKVCKNKLLANATFILLLNKADLLHAKLKAGIKFEEFVTSYQGRPNKTEYVADCEFVLGSNQGKLSPPIS